MNTSFSICIPMLVIWIAILVLLPAYLSHVVLRGVARWQVEKWIGAWCGKIQSKIDGHGKAD